MTYKKLLENLQAFSLEQLSMDVTIFEPATKEHYPLYGVFVAQEGDDVLDVGHPYLELKV